MKLIFRPLVEAIAFVCIYLAVRDRFDPIQGDVYIFAAIYVLAMFGTSLLITSTRLGKSFDKWIETFVARATAIMLRTVNARASVVILIILGIGCIAAAAFFFAGNR